ncbi:hypothetical protein GF369_01885 [Candidatus Peregrinibacteria bacterium]|nr:hypothetical protein [Candidatus Peregrinibacteria bacterium]
MAEENKQKQNNSDNAESNQSSMQNEELTIAPIGDTSDDAQGSQQQQSPQPQQQDKQEQSQEPQRQKEQEQKQVQKKPALSSDISETKSSNQSTFVGKPEKDEDQVFAMDFQETDDKKSPKKEEAVIKDEKKPLQLFIFQRTERKSFLESLVAMIALVLFAGVLFGASVFADISHEAQQQERQHEGITLLADTTRSLQEGSVVDTADDGQSVLLIGNREIIRLGEDTIVTVMSVDEDTYEFELERGRIWGNTLYGPASYVIHSTYATVTSNNAAFSMVLGERQTTVYSEKNDVQVDLIADNNVINTLWVAQGNQAQILHSKIESDKETIARLLYSKLIKEVNYGRLNEQKKKDDPWLSQQIQNDIAYTNNLKKEYTQQIDARGLKTVSIGSLRSQAKSLLADVQTALTFNQNKRNERMIDTLFEHITDAEYLFLQENEVDGNVRLSLFENDMQEMMVSADQAVKQQVFDRLVATYNDVSLFVPGDALFPVKKSVFDSLTGSSMRRLLDEEVSFYYLTAYLNDVYAAVSSQPLALPELFSEYFSLYELFTRSYTDKMDEIRTHIIHQNILVDNLLFQTPALYNVDFFDSKKNMEKDYLSALPTATEKQEQRQTFISSNINLLSRIRYFLFNESIETDDARQIVYRLIQDIEEYQKQMDNVVAVNELFNRRLADFGVFFEYLRATEYSSTQLHGASHEERFEAFKKVQEEVLSYEDIKDEILGETPQSEESVDALKVRIKQDLQEAGIQDVEFGAYTDVTKKKIPILSARVAGIGFRATYDWDRELLSNIIVDNIVISQEGVKLLKAKTFITQTMASLSRAEEKEVSRTQEQPEEEENDVDRVARVFVAEKFSEMDMVITMENVEVIDLDAGEYRISDVYFQEERKALFSFVYSTRDDKITDLTVQTKQGEKMVDDTFPSTFINDLVLKIYEESQ